MTDTKLRAQLTATLATALPLAALWSALVAPAAAEELKPWRHAVIEPKSDAGFVMMASRRGFGEKYGLKIEAVPVKDGNLAIKAMLSGEVDSVESGAGEEIVAASHGAALKVVGCNWPGLPHALFAKADIAKVEDLKGKTVAASAPGSLPELLVRTVLEAAHVPVADVHIASVGGDLDRYKSLTAGVVDAAVISGEYLPVAPPSVKLLLAGRDAMPNYMRLCIAVTNKTLAERGDAVTKFLAAEAESLRYAFSHRDETIALAREVISAKPDDPRLPFVYDETVKHRDADPDLPIPTDKLAWMQAQLVKTGNVQQPIDMGLLIDPAPRTKAIALLGK
jgi:NitT/TauT family transport system substrate-binding protein